LPGFDIQAWAGMFGPAGLPAEAVETLDRELAKIPGAARGQGALLDAGSEVQWKGPRNFQAS